MSKRIISAIFGLLLILVLPGVVLAAGSLCERKAASYTQADYDLALSFRTEGYEDMPVAAFDRLAFDWEDEEAYHRNEEAFTRVLQSLKEDDPHADFLLGTLKNALDACQVKHYNACGRAADPWHGENARVELYGDVFGDDVLLYGAYADYCFNYNVSDEAALTVGRRDAVLKEVEAGMEAFLNGQAKEALRDHDAMERTLKAELESLLESLSGELRWAGKLDLGYYFEEPYAFTEMDADSGVAWPDTYTQAQYDQVLSSLMPQGYEDMSVASFDRMVHAAFMEDDSERDGLNEAYEIVVVNLPDSDPAAGFLKTAVSIALEEYASRVREAYTGKPSDVSRSEWAQAYQEEDVYGDSVVVGSIDADYTFTYRLLNARQLTVRERDRFLSAIKDGADAVLREALKSGDVSKENFEAGLKAVGEAAGNDLIQFTGCSVSYLEYAR